MLCLWKDFFEKKQVSLDEEQLWVEYVKGKQTYAQLAEKYACSAKTIKRKLDSYSVKKEAKTARKVIVFNEYNILGKNIWSNAF